MEPNSHTLPVLPREADGKGVKIVVDLEFDQQEGRPPVEVGVKPCDFWWALRVTTPPGRSRLTYVFNIDKAVEGKRYEFSYKGGEKPWTVRYSNLRIYC